MNKRLMSQSVLRGPELGGDRMHFKVGLCKISITPHGSPLTELKMITAWSQNQMKCKLKKFLLLLSSSLRARKTVRSFLKWSATLSWSCPCAENDNEALSDSLLPWSVFR